MSYSQFKYAYQVCPIILNDGIAANLTPAQLPIVSLLQGASFSTGLFGSTDLQLDDYFAQFRPLPGGTLVENAVGKYPFANQQTAANAIIVQPLHQSFLMICPARGSTDYEAKKAIMGNLQSALQQHSITGGTYTLATPSWTSSGWLLTSLRDVSSNESKQPQVSWQWDFEQPLISLEQARQSYNALLSKIGANVPVTTPSWSGPSAVSGVAASGTAPSVIPAAKGASGAFSPSPFPQAQ